jgi:hypothetical protein
MGISAYALVTLQELKSSMKEESDAQDEQLDMLVNSVSSIIESYCNRKFLARDYVEYYDGKGSDCIVLNQFPVNSVSEVADDLSMLWPSISIIDSANYTVYADEGIIKLLPGYYAMGAIAGSFYDGARNVRVT